MGATNKLYDNIQRLIDRIGRLESRVAQLERINNFNQMPHMIELSDGAREVLNLPKHLQRTFMELEKLKQATAATISEHTQRARAVESSYLNQLVMMGFASKNRGKGRTVIFSTKLTCTPKQDVVY